MERREKVNACKEHGFKWSRRNEAWQRQITANAKYDIKHFIMPKLNETAK